MVSKKKIAVIGGGVSGLAAAKTFKQHGHDVTGFERASDFGGVWEVSRSYPDVKTQSSKSVYQFTDFPMPENFPEWPSGAQVREYLQSYATHFELLDLFQLGTEVAHMTRRKDGKPGWSLSVTKDGKERSEDFDFVAIGTGQFSDRKELSYPGQEDFEAAGGMVLHSSEYTDPAIVKDKNVVVLGGSKSATDIAVNATRYTTGKVTMVYREKVWRMPYKVAGLINFKHLAFSRFGESHYEFWSPSKLQHAVWAVSKPLAWIKYRAFELILKIQLGLKKHDMVPEHPLETQPSCAFPIVSDGFFPALKSGKLKAERGTFERYETSAVTLDNGKTIPCDVAILAVGWNVGIPFLDVGYQSSLFEEDGQFRLYRFAVNPDLPDMGFVGFNSSFATILSADMSANWLVRYMDGTLKHMPTKEEMQSNIEMMLHYKRSRRPGAADYGGVCAAPFHFMQFDELLEDIGATKRKHWNPAVEYFSYPRPANYGEFLKSAPHYHAE